MTAYECRGVSFGYPQAARMAVRDVSVRIDKARVFAIVGPNGSGKSTLLRLLAGTSTPASGSVDFMGRSLTTWPRREVARVLGVVTQAEELQFPLSVRDLVGLGRYPYLGPWQRERDVDQAAVSAAMDRCGVTDLADRPASEVSGGEFQRVRVARALAQEPEVLLLDEPTTSLDIHYQMSIFELLRDLCHNDGVTVVVVTHQLNLAARFADELLLLQEGRAIRWGVPKEVLVGPVLEDVYGWPLSVVPFAGPGPDQGAPQIVPLRTDSREGGKGE